MTNKGRFAAWLLLGLVFVTVLAFFIQGLIEGQQKNADALAEANEKVKVLGTQLRDLGQDPEVSTKPVIGAPGEAGEAGKQGERGVSGERGATGPQGLTGASPTLAQVLSAVTSYCSVSIVCQGPEGAAGAKGVDGKSGSDGSDSAVPGPRGETGAPGDRGPTGETGPKGETGDTGAAGADGANGVGISSLACQSRVPITLSVTLTDGSVQEVTCGG